MARVQKRTKYLKHQDLACIHPALFHLRQQLILLHLVHTKQEFCDPTTIVWRYTNRACYLPTQNNVVPSLLVLSSRGHRELHPLQLSQVVQLLRTIAKINVVQQLLRNVGNVQLSVNKDAFPNQFDHPYATVQQLLCALRNGPCHQIVYLFQTSRRARS